MNTKRSLAFIVMAAFCAVMIAGAAMAADKTYSGYAWDWFYKEGKKELGVKTEGGIKQPDIIIIFHVTDKNLAKMGNKFWEKYEKEKVQINYAIEDGKNIIKDIKVIK